MPQFEVDIELNGKKYTVDVEAPDQDQAVNAVNKISSTPDGIKSLLGEPIGESEILSNRTKQIISEVARPVLEVGGGVGGAVIAAPGLVTTPAGGALGFAAGKSAADLLDRALGIQEPIDSIKSAVGETGKNALSGLEMEALNLVMGPVINGIGKATRFSAKQGIETFFGPTKEAISARFNRPGDIKGKTINDVVKKIPETLNKITGEIKILDKKAWDKLINVKDEPRDQIIKILSDVKKGISLDGGKTVGKSAKQAIKTIDDLIGDISQFQGENINQKQIRQIIQAADENIDYNNPLSGRTNEALLEFRVKLNNYLRTKNPEFAKIMDPLAKRMEMVKDMVRSFSIGNENGVYVPGDTTASRLKLSNKEDRVAVKKLMDELKSEFGDDVAKDIQDALFSQQFSGGKANGSRMVNLLGTTGGGLGSFIGGVPGAIIGSNVGVGTGALIDKQGGEIAGNLIDFIKLIASSSPVSGGSNIINSPLGRRLIASGLISD